ncbi:phage portal protein [Psychrobacillus sp. FSL H8-0483]|uniref:phage portal protein n=1 Tax=Psychrobacillus sp. FSL H8-0483 TaxID=2921389 RepID=UPI00315A56E2
MNLKQYVKVKYKNIGTWFVEEVEAFHNTSRVLDIQNKRDYLEGHHNILNRPNYQYNGQLVEPRKIVLNMAKTILSFQTQFLLKNPVQITGKEKMVEEFQVVNKLGKFNEKNIALLDKLLKFGNVYEYIYIDKKGYITSKIINRDEGFPVYNQHNEMIGFIEQYVFDGISYYVVYDDEKVQEWNNEDGSLIMTSQFANLSGLPVAYVSTNEHSETEGRSQLDDFIGILDNMEDLISKTVDGLYKMINPVPVISGQQLKGSVPQHIVGGGIQLDDGGTFSFESATIDAKAFDILYTQLYQSLLDISMTPSVSMGRAEISNVSEQSVRLLFSLASVKGGMNEQCLRKGFYERWDKIRSLLTYKGININDKAWSTFDVLFTYDLPSNNAEVIGNLRALREMGALSMESMLELSPMTSDVGQEMERLSSEGKSRDQVQDELDVNS